MTAHNSSFMPRYGHFTVFWALLALYWEGWPKRMFRSKNDPPLSFFFMRVLDSPIQSRFERIYLIGGEVKRSLATCSHLKFCLKGDQGGVQLNVIAGTGYPQQLGTGGHRSSRCIEPPDSAFGLAFFSLFLDLDLNFLYCVLSIL